MTNFSDFGFLCVFLSFRILFDIMTEISTIRLFSNIIPFSCWFVSTSMRPMVGLFALFSWKYKINKVSLLLLFGNAINIAFDEWDILYWNWIDFSRFLFIHSNQHIHGKCRTISPTPTPPPAATAQIMPKTLRPPWTVHCIRISNPPIFFASDGHVRFSFAFMLSETSNSTPWLHISLQLYTYTRKSRCAFTSSSASTWQPNARIKLWRNGKWYNFFHFSVSFDDVSVWCFTTSLAPLFVFQKMKSQEEKFCT